MSRRKRQLDSWTEFKKAWLNYVWRPIAISAIIIRQRSDITDITLKNIDIETQCTLSDEIFFACNVCIENVLVIHLKKKVEKVDFPRYYSVLFPVYTGRKYLLPLLSGAYGITLPSRVACAARDIAVYSLASSGLSIKHY